MHNLRDGSATARGRPKLQTFRNAAAGAERFQAFRATGTSGSTGAPWRRMSGRSVGIHVAMLIWLLPFAWLTACGPETTIEKADRPDNPAPVGDWEDLEDPGEQSPASEGENAAKSEPAAEEEASATSGDLAEEEPSVTPGDLAEEEDTSTSDTPPEKGGPATPGDLSEKDDPATPHAPAEEEVPAPPETAAEQQERATQEFTAEPGVEGPLAERARTLLDVPGESAAGSVIHVPDVAAIADPTEIDTTDLEDAEKRYAEAHRALTQIRAPAGASVLVVTDETGNELGSYGVLRSEINVLEVDSTVPVAGFAAAPGELSDDSPAYARPASDLAIELARTDGLWVGRRPVSADIPFAVTDAEDGEKRLWLRESRSMHLVIDTEDGTRIVDPGDLYRRWIALTGGGEPSGFYPARIHSASLTDLTGDGRPEIDVVVDILTDVTARTPPALHARMIVAPTAEGIRLVTLLPLETRETAGPTMSGHHEFHYDGSELDAITEYLALRYPAYEAQASYRKRVNTRTLRSNGEFVLPAGPEHTVIEEQFPRTYVTAEDDVPLRARPDREAEEVRRLDSDVQVQAIGLHPVPQWRDEIRGMWYQVDSEEGAWVWGPNLRRPTEEEQ